MNKEYSNLTANDMVGMQFGKIAVIKRLQNDKKRNAILLCRCGCGKEFSARASQIKSGKTKSCGCRAGTSFDIAGKKFGKLTAIKKTRRAENGDAIWNCLCDCGATVDVIASKLNRGDTMSCGCAASERGKISLANQRFMNTQVTRLNSNPSKANKTGVRGVFYNKRNGKFEASIAINRRRIQLGKYKTLDEARKARERAEEIYWEPVKEMYNSCLENTND